MATVEVGYNGDQGYNVFTVLTNKFNSSYLVPNDDFI